MTRHVQYMQHPGLTSKRRAATCRLMYRFIESCKVCRSSKRQAEETLDERRSRSPTYKSSGYTSASFVRADSAREHRSVTLSLENRHEVQSICLAVKTTRKVLWDIRIHHLAQQLSPTTYHNSHQTSYRKQHIDQHASFPPIFNP
jgi:hypothetical protein